MLKELQKSENLCRAASWPRKNSPRAIQCFQRDGETSMPARYERTAGRFGGLEIFAETLGLIRKDFGRQKCVLRLSSEKVSKW